jgi:phytoene desaturase
LSKIAIIGSGFSGLSAAAYLSVAGNEVHVFEKNKTAGGRARQLKTDNGYVFDMGPSWYWMPDVFEDFFNDFGFSVKDFYDLKLLDPSFEIVFPNDQKMKVPADFNELCVLFESIEKGSAIQLKKFMAEAKYKYDTGMKNLSKMPGISVTEFATPDLMKGVLRLQIFSSFSKHVRKYFSNPKLIALMEFPVLFLGAMPEKTPALYSLMNYAGLKLGTWYPKGGFGKIVDAMVGIAKRNGASFHFNAEVEKIEVKNSSANAIKVNGKSFSFDAVVATADYNHVEKKLLAEEFRNYEEDYWEKRTFAPSCLIFFVGIKKKITSIEHHTLFFEEDLATHSTEIYESPVWPSKPLFYVCCPSVSDETIAPEGHENLFFLMPVAPGLEDSESVREKYFSIMINRLEKHILMKISESIDFKKSYCINDFVEDYHAFKGNAYGLANTLMQTAILKPKLRNRKLKNLVYAGQLTVPGPGVPPSIISGKLASEQLLHFFYKSKKHENII